MNQIVGYQLQRAVKSTGSTALARRVNVHETAARILRALEKVYAQQPREIVCDIDSAIVFLGDERDLMEMLGNLLDDDGPGIPAGQQEFVLQRGARLDTLAQGQGIGLAVVTDIVGSYGGQIDVGTGSRGGARIQLVFGNFQLTASEPARG